MLITVHIKLLESYQVQDQIVYFVPRQEEPTRFLPEKLEELRVQAADFGELRSSLVRGDQDPEGRCRLDGEERAAAQRNLHS